MGSADWDPEHEKSVPPPTLSPNLLLAVERTVGLSLVAAMSSVTTRDCTFPRSVTDILVGVRNRKPICCRKRPRAAATHNVLSSSAAPRDVSISQSRDASGTQGTPGGDGRDAPPTALFV